LQIAQYVFSDRDNNYQSPYYYENYPDYYEAYRVVETPVYRTRIEEYYPQPVFIQTQTPRVRDVRIKSQYQDKSINKIYAKLAKPTKEQIQFIKNNPNRPQFVEAKKNKVKDVPPKFKEIQARTRNDFEKRGNGNGKKFEARNNPKQAVKENRVERENVKPNRPEKVERQQMKPNKIERQFEKPNKPDNPNKGGGGGNGNGGGNGKGNGGGNGGGKGKGKG
jgi:plasmid maintenance system killer protein